MIKVAGGFNVGFQKWKDPKNEPIRFIGVVLIIGKPMGS